MKILPSLQTPSLPIPVKEPTLVFHCLISFSWLILYLRPLQKVSKAVISYNAMALWDQLIEKQHRSSCLSNSLIQFVSCWLHYCSWHCIILCASCENWLLRTFSKIVTVLCWWWPQRQVLFRLHRKMWKMTCFCLCVCRCDVNLTLCKDRTTYLLNKSSQNLRLYS